MSAHLEVLLARLELVRKAGAGWSARCPAHKDRGPSLSISAGDDGRVLLHCHAGCSATDVVQAVGLTLSDLFPERIRGDDSPSERRQRRIAARTHQWAAALPVLEFEARLLLIAAGDMQAGRALDDNDRARLALAVQRIEDARALFNPVNLRDHIRDMAQRNEAMRAGVTG